MSDAKPSKPSRRGQQPPATKPARAATTSQPEISLSEGEIGRNTLLELRDDLKTSTPAPKARPPMMTVSYHDSPLGNAEPSAQGVPAVAAVAPTPRSSASSVPEIEVGESYDAPIGRSPTYSAPTIEIGPASVSVELVPDVDNLGERETVLPVQQPSPKTSAAVPKTTLASMSGQANEAIKVARAQRASSSPSIDAEPRCEALELKTYVVPQSELSPKSTEKQKKAFVRTRLASYLPCDVEDIRRIDVKIFEPGAVMLRIWCPVP